ncbi:MAG: SRPBCC family protein [Opitutales bacterium]|nr:SRPBCC family protein [Opitutales bacterium]
MEHDLHAEIELPLNLDTVFEFFSKAENLERITPSELKFRILNPTPVPMQVGTLIDYRLQLFGMPFKWSSLISEWDPPHSFTDEQVKGPYALWVHRHSFEPTENGTRIRDHVRYRLPLSPLGDLALPLVKLQLRRIFAHRQQAVQDALMQTKASAG